MEHIEVEKIVMVSDISESSSNECKQQGLLPEPIRGVRNGNLPHFVTKLYDIVSNKATDATISWVRSGATSFVIWNEQDFINNLLPMISKSKKFNSFVYQLNNYGFKKISWIRCEYAHQWFQEGNPHLLKNITRRSKQNNSLANKMALEITKLECESKEFDLELKKFKEYVDNTISNQKRIVREMAKTTISTFGHNHLVPGANVSNERENNNKGKATQSLNLTGQRRQEAIGQTTFSQSCVIEEEAEL